MISLAERLRQLEEFNRWEESNSAPERPFSAVLADLSFLLSLLPEEVRNADPDPEKLGVQELHRLLARYTVSKASANERT
jgi:hypothetical protein